MYLALARKYRPQDFTEVIGQDPVMKTLKNAIEQSRLHHAYLFTGARGVGKTSMARILAKSINCENGPTIKPCQQCESCSSITKGTSMDVIEIDAASNTGVDHIRELREQVKYLPGSGKYKIFIIDEVHMLSNSAFNALLKTLEEPPEHVMFVMATTEPHEIPITILSRCQRFDFRKMNKSVLVEHLKSILAKENRQAEEGAVQLVADCAQGSVRDALSLLDQVMGYQSEKLTEEEVRSLLGLGDRLLLQETFKALVTGNLQKSLESLSQADQNGLDLKVFAESLIHAYRHLILLVSTKMLPHDVSSSEKEFFTALVDRVELSLLLAQYQILFQGLNEVSRTEFQKTSLEVTFVKISQAHEMISLTDLVVELKERAAGKKAQSARTAMPEPSQAPTHSQTAPASRSQPHKSAKNWYELVQWMKKVKPPLGSVLSDAVPINYSTTRIEVGFSKHSPGQALIRERVSQIEDMLASHFGQKVAFVISDLNEEKKKP